MPSEAPQECGERVETRFRVPTHGSAVDSNEPTSALMTVTELQLGVAWLAGILDGEGSIAMPNNGKGIGIAVRVDIFNTSTVLLNKVSAVIDAMGLEHSRYEKLASKTNALSRKPVYRVCLSGRENVVKFLIELMPHLTEKRTAAAAVVNVFSGRTLGSKWTPDEATKAKAVRATLRQRPYDIVRYSDESRRVQG